MNWVEQIYDLSNSGKTREAYGVLFNAIEDIFDARQLGPLNISLRELDVDRLSAEIVTAVLRGACRAKAALSEWRPLLERLVAKCERENVPEWEKLLVGLR